MATAAGYTAGELMVAAAAREIRDGEVVFVGMRLPLLAFCLARVTHAPGAVGLFENGVVRDAPAEEFIVTMSDGPNVRGAVWTTEMREVMGLLQAGRVDLGFIGGAQVDRFGNLNTTWVGPRPGGQRLPGSGGGADIASLARRHVIIMAHERRRFVERVDYLTSPGHGTGGDWRRRVGLPGQGPAAVITTLGILRFEAGSGEMALASVHPGVGPDDVQAQTGWPLRRAAGLAETPAPTPDELATIRRFDPDGFWTRGRE
jgi:glutaconate CoA-transferase subunit B